MKSPCFFLKSLFVWGTLAVLSGCVSLGSSPGNSWSSKNRSKIAGTLELNNVSVDKPADRTSVEKEIRGRAALFFLERKYLLVPEGETASYRADVRAIEREYISGWKTRRSVSVEVFIRQNGEGDRDPVPLASGRATGTGNISLSASPVLDRFLRTAVKRAVRALKK
ncbi:MAG: hypothetical protein LBT93_03645 [Treponema sp.]|jgi:hypothetical protein|nr:hypothetical protein [Treponema sp.]